MDTTPSLAQLGQSVSALANELRARADRLGRGDLARLIAAEAERWGETAASVVLIGATGAGKSSLVATLTGRPDVYPAGTPTASPIIVRHQPLERAQLVTVDGERDELPVAALASATIDRRRHQFVELGLRAPRLVDRTTLVDTPGFGGAADRGGNAAYLATRRADALIVVVDLAAPVSRPDVDAIVRCADRFAEITVVGTRIDRIRGWQRVLDDSAAAIGAAVPHAQLTSIGVSNRLADAAYEADDDAEAVALLEESGVGDLQHVIVTVGDRLRHIRLANFTALLEGVAGELDREGRARIAEAEEGQQRELDRLAQLRSELGQVRDDRASWFVALGDAIATTRDESTQDLTRTVAHLTARYDERSATWRGPADPLLDEFRDDLRTEAAAFASRLADRLDRLVEQMVTATEVADLGVRIDPTSLVRTLAELDAAPAAAPHADGQQRLRATGSMVSMATSSTMMMGALHGAGGADLMRLGAYGAATLFAGLTTAVTIAGTRRNRTRQQIRTEMRSMTQAITTTAPGSLRTFFLQVQRGIEAHLKEAARLRIQALEAEQRDVQGTSRIGAAERRRAVTVAEQEIKALEAAVDQARRLAAQLGAVSAR